MIDFFKQQVGKLGALGVSLAIPTWVRSLDLKIAHYDASANPARMEFNQTCIFVFWHEYIMLPTCLWGNTDVTLLVSQHRDADWLVNTANYLGFDAIRGSTTRGGSTAIRACKEKLKTHSIAVTPDGPKGPRREMAVGALFLASRLQCPIVPVGFGYQNPIRLRTWDRFALLRPGSRARAAMGPKVMIPRHANRDELETYRRRLTNDLNELTTLCERSAELGSSIEHQHLFEQTRKFRASRVVEFDHQASALQGVDLRQVADKTALQAA